jgi:hypothetical protein
VRKRTGGNTGIRRCGELGSGAFHKLHLQNRKTKTRPPATKSLTERLVPKPADGPSALR